MTIQVGDKLPLNFKLRFIDDSNVTPNDQPNCKVPSIIVVNQNFLSKYQSIIIVSVPAAFSPTCSNVHLPKILKNFKTFESKKVDLIIILSNDSAFALNNWKKQLAQQYNVDLKPYEFGSFNKSKGLKVVFASDSNTEFSKEIGFTQDSSKMGMGIRTTRYGMVVSKGVVEYCKQESKAGVDVSSGEVLLSKL